jgi:hypothetical protein
MSEAVSCWPTPDFMHPSTYAGEWQSVVEHRPQRRLDRRQVCDHVRVSAAPCVTLAAIRSDVSNEAVPKKEANDDPDSPRSIACLGLHVGLEPRRAGMPDRQTTRRARRDAREGKSKSTQAGEFVREEMRHIREGKHGAQSTKQAIAIGLSKARRAGVDLPAKKGTSARTREQAKRDIAKGRKHGRKVSATRSRAVRVTLRGDGRTAASSRSLAKQARTSASRRTASQRSAAARKAARTKGSAGRKAAARKAARTRARH